jgi:hypothetical protein
MSTESFFQKALNALLSIFKNAPDEIKTIEDAIVAFADKVTNVIKNNPSAVATLESLAAIAEGIFPALVPLVNGLELEIPNLMKIISNGAIELSEPLAKQEADFLTWLASVKAGNPVIYAGIPTSINAAIQAYITNNSGTILTPTPTQLLASSIAVHANAA